MTRRCRWCGSRADTAAEPERCPQCRAPWPTLGNPLGLSVSDGRGVTAAETVRGQLAAFDNPDEAADVAFVIITERLGL